MTRDFRTRPDGVRSSSSVFQAAGNPWFTERDKRISFGDAEEPDALNAKRSHRDSRLHVTPGKVAKPQTADEARKRALRLFAFNQKLGRLERTAHLRKPRGQSP